MSNRRAPRPVNNGGETALLSDWMIVTLAIMGMCLILFVILAFVVPPAEHARAYTPTPPTTQQTIATTTKTTTTTSPTTTTAPPTTPPVAGISLFCPADITLNLGAPYTVNVTGNAIAQAVGNAGTACQSLFVQCFDSVGAGPQKACILDSMRDNNGARPSRNVHTPKSDMSNSVQTGEPVYFGIRGDWDPPARKKDMRRQHHPNRTFHSDRISKTYHAKRVRTDGKSTRSVTFGNANVVLSPNSFEQPYTGSNPSDCNSAVGALDQVITVYNSAGSAKYSVSDALSLSTVLASDFIGNLGVSSSNCSTGNTRGEPIVLWDVFATNLTGGRWIIAEVGEALTSYCVHISNTQDALGAWTSYEFAVPSANAFPSGLSYPKMGSWPRLYGLTAFNLTCVIDKIAMWNLNATVAMMCSPQTGFEWTPANVESDTVPLETEGFGNSGLPGAVFMSLTDDELGSGAPPSGRNDFINVLHWYTVNFTSLTVQSRRTIYQVEVLDYDLRSAPIPTPNSGLMNPVAGIIMNRLVYRNFPDRGEQSAVGAFVSNSNGLQIARVRWFELRWYQLSPNLQPQFHVYQDGEISSGDFLYKFLPSITIDGWGNIALGFTTSSALQYPRLAATMQLRNDPINQMRNLTVVKASPTPPISTPTTAWGAYGSMSVLSPNQFYFSGQVGAVAPGLWTATTMLFNGQTEVYNRTFMASYYQCLTVVVNCTQFITALG